MCATAAKKCQCLISRAPVMIIIIMIIIIMIIIINRIPAHDERGMCGTSLVSPEQFVLHTSISLHDQLSNLNNAAHVLHQYLCCCQHLYAGWLPLGCKRPASMQLHVKLHHSSAEAVWCLDKTAYTASSVSCSVMSSVTVLSLYSC